MRVLSIDTSGHVSIIGVIDGEEIMGDFTFEAKFDSLKKIVSNIDFVLKNANLTLGNIQGFGVGLGPGSWTGVRVGVTVGKILAYVTNKPVCGVSGLEVLAYNARNIPASICPIIDAGRGAICAAFYHAKNGAVARVSEYYVGDIQKLLETIKEPTVFIGSGARLYRKLIIEMLGSLSVNVGAIEDIPRGSVLALLAANRFEHGQYDNVLSLEPLYLKESTARAFQHRYSINTGAKGQSA